MFARCQSTVLGGAADQELDLRARVWARQALSPGFDVYASLSPGYATLRSGGGADYHSTGFAMGGALGFTYDLAWRLFFDGEVGYQRSFTRTRIRIAEDAFVSHLELSYLHFGLGAGVRF